MCAGILAIPEIPCPEDPRNKCIESEGPGEIIQRVKCLLYKCEHRNSNPRQRQMRQQMPVLPTPQQQDGETTGESPQHQEPSSLYMQQ